MIKTNKIYESGNFVGNYFSQNSISPNNTDKICESGDFVDNSLK